MSTPTPEKWEARNWGLVENAYRWGIFDVDGDLIAVTRGRIIAAPNSDAEADSERSAHLIAAAPELAAVCRELVALFDDGWSADKFSALARRATAALAKAEGTRDE